MPRKFWIDITWCPRNDIEKLWLGSALKLCLHVFWHSIHDYESLVLTFLSLEQIKINSFQGQIHNICFFVDWIFGLFIIFFESQNKKRWLSEVTKKEEPEHFSGGWDIFEKMNANAETLLNMQSTRHFFPSIKIYAANVLTMSEFQLTDHAKSQMSIMSFYVRPVCGYYASKLKLIISQNRLLFFHSILQEKTFDKIFFFCLVQKTNFWLNFFFFVLSRKKKLVTNKKIFLKKVVWMYSCNSLILICFYLCF